MQKSQLKSYDNLICSLQQIIKVYRGLLDNLRSEKNILIQADLNDLNKNNVAKEKLLVHVGRLEKQRVLLTKEFATVIEFNSEDPRLLDIANHLGGESGDKLRNLHSVLVLLLKRVKEHNDQNDVLVRSALENVTGAMKSIKETVSEGSTYKRKGNVLKGTTQSGRLVSKEA